jgi:hypothetical protein
MSITIGDSIDWSIPLVNDDGAPFLLRGVTVVCTCKRHTSEPDSAALFRHYLTTDNAGVVTSSQGMQIGPGGPDAGVVIESLTAAETALFARGEYRWDLKVRDGDGKVHTALRGTEAVLGSYTGAIP